MKASRPLYVRFSGRDPVPARELWAGLALLAVTGALGWLAAVLAGWK